MKRFCLLFVLFGALVGCYGPTMKVRVSDERSDYSIYCNGVQVCDRSDSCEFPTLWSDEVFYLQVRRNNVIYAFRNTRVFPRRSGLVRRPQGFVTGELPMG